MESNTQVFGRFRLLEVLGAGGMAEVFLAKLEGPEGFERKLAIKRILPNFSKNDSFVQMFIDEARLVGHFTHPNIVQIYDFGKIDESYYISMEYVEGINIADILSRYKAANMFVPLEVILEVGIQACRGIDYAHRETDESGRPLGIIHRDLTPHNILVSKKGVVKITDFGIAKASMNTHMTQAGMIKGKVPYMSPEQATGMPLNQMSDVFSFGIVMYEMCTLKRLFDGENDFTILRKVQEAKIPSIREQNPDIPEELERIIYKALARDRGERYQWASEMEADLTRLKFSYGALFTRFSLAEFVQQFMATSNKVRRPVETAPAAPAAAGAQGPAAIGGPAPLAGAGAAGGASAPATSAVKESLSALAAGLSDVGDPLHLGSRQEPMDLRATMVVDKNDPAAFAGAHATRPEPTARTGAANTAASPGASAAPTHPDKVPGAQRLLMVGLGVVAMLILVIGVFFSSPSTGAVSLEISQPDAEIYVNDQKVGTGGTYTVEEIPGGSSVVIKVVRQGFKEYTRTIKVEAGIRYRLPVKLEELPRFGFLTVETTPPGARVLVRGKDNGWVTPVTVNLGPDLPYDLQIVLDGYLPRSETLTLKADEKRTLNLSLEPAVPSAPDGGVPSPGTGAPTNP